MAELSPHLDSATPRPTSGATGSTGMPKAGVDSPVRSLEDLPCPRGLPLLGNLLQLDIPRIHKILYRWAGELGPLYRIRVAHRDAVAVSSPDLINEILRDRPERFQRIEIMRDGMLELKLDSVFTAEGSDWRRHRKLVMHALNTDHLREFFPRLDLATSRLQRRWQRAAASGERVNAQADLMRFTVDVTSGLAFGRDLNTLEQQGDVIQQELATVFPELARRTFAPFPYWRWFKSRHARRVDAAMERVLVLVHELVAAARDRVASNAARQAPPGNLLEAMVTAQSDDASGFTDAEIVGNVLILLLAGEDTTANTLAWMMHLMSEYPEVQANMQSEADRALDGGERLGGYASAKALRYIEAVAHEAMRLLPVSPLQGAQPVKDTVLGGVLIPKDTAIYMLAGHASTAPENFSDPKSFQPERWLDLPGASHNTHASVPFGAGPRFCPGRHLAMLEIKAVAAMLCRNFEVSHFPGDPPPEELFSFTMGPRNLFVRLQPRGHAGTRSEG